MYRTFFVILFASLCFWGCQEDPPQTAEQQIGSPTAEPNGLAARAAVADQGSAQAPTGDIALFDEPIEPVVLELPSEALPYWRDASGPGKPTLVLLSIHPLLTPLDAGLQPDVNALLAGGDAPDFMQHGSLYRAQPLILPTQTTSAAISADLFSEILWVFPSTTAQDSLRIDLFRKQVTDAAFLTKEEADALTLEDGVFTGEVRGVPFRAAHPDALPELSGPTILHVDLGYFKGLYQGEVKTRIYDILHKSALGLNETGWQPLLTTLSYSTFEGTFSLDVRFLLTDFADMLRDPSLLDGTMPQNWALRSEALYAVNFFLDSKVQEYYEQAAREYPEEASAQYDLYRHMFFEQRKVDEALKVLDKAIALDRGYAAAYLELAQIAANDKNLEAALDLLGRAAPIVAENPMIDLYRAQFLLQSGRRDEAIPLIRQLQGLAWSKHYHPDVPQLLEQMLNAEPAGQAKVKDEG